MKTALKYVALFVLLTSLAAAQENGTANWGAADSFTVDSIDLATLTPSVNIPVLAKKGAIPFSFNLNLTTACWITGLSQAQAAKCSSTSPSILNVGMAGMSAGWSSDYLTGSCDELRGFFVSDA